MLSRRKQLFYEHPRHVLDLFPHFYLQFPLGTLEGRKAGISFGVVMADFSFTFTIFFIVFIIIIHVFYIFFFIFFQDFFGWMNKVQLQTPVFSASMEELLVGDPNLLQNEPAVMSVGFEANPGLPCLPYTRNGWRECSALHPGSPEFWLSNPRPSVHSCRLSLFMGEKLSLFF